MSSNVLPAERAMLGHRIVEIPVADTEVRVQNATEWHRMLTALAPIHAEGRPLVVGWLRSRAGGPVNVLVGGLPHSAAAAPRESVPVNFPPGARATSLAPVDVDKLLDKFVWTPTELAVNASSVDADSTAPRLEDLFAFSADRRMAFLVVARPLNQKATDARVEVLSDEVGRLEAHRAGRGIKRRQLTRAEDELEYFDRWAAQGCWELEAWTGGDTEAAGQSVAAMLAGSADIAGCPLLIRPSGGKLSSLQTWSSRSSVGADVVASLVRPPSRELPGVRAVTTPEFDQNVEQQIDVAMGAVLDGTRARGAPFGLALESVNRHVFVAGATGSGKSETVRSLLVGLSTRGIPWLVIEPAKSEYAGLAPWLDPDNPLVVIRPGDPKQPPPHLNPLEPSSIDVAGVRHTFPLQTHLDMVRALFTASFDAVEPFPQVVGAALTRSYEREGWNLALGRAVDGVEATPRWPTLEDLTREALTVVDDLGYGHEVRDNVRGFIKVRIGSLRSGTPGRFFEGGHPLDLEDLLNHPTIFEIEDLGDDMDKAFFIGNLIIRIFEILRLRHQFGHPSPDLTHVLVIEEAHRLLRQATGENGSSHAVEMFANLLAEIRAYGEGMVVAEQIPSKLLSDVVKNSAVKIVHRLPAEEDRNLVGGTMNLTEAQSAHVVALRPGESVAHAAGMDRPVMVAHDRVAQLPTRGATLASPRLSSRCAACPQSCSTAPCTLEGIETSRALSYVDQRALWVEQVVVAHLTGELIGTPAGDWFTHLQDADLARSRCAIALEVDSSVSRRRGLIRPQYDPDALAQHLSELLAAQVTTGRGLGRPSYKWRIGVLRLRDIGRSLGSPAASDDQETPHPSTDAWRQQGVTLPGPTWAHQQEQLTALARTLPKPARRQFAGEPSILPMLARNLGDGASLAVQLGSAVASLGLESGWIAHRVGADEHERHLVLE